MTRPLSSNVEHIREAVKSLRDTVIEDRKQMMYRVAFGVAIIAFTFKDLKIADSDHPRMFGVLLAIAFSLMASGGFLFYVHFYKSIGVVAELSKCLAYSDISQSDLNASDDYWEKGKLRWKAGTTLFFGGCGFYFLALIIELFTTVTHILPF